MKRSELFFSAILVPLDFLMLLVAGLAAYWLRVSPWLVQYRPVLFYLNLPFERYLILVVALSLLSLIIFALVGLYKIKPVRSLPNDFFKIVAAVSAGLIVLVFYIFIRREWFDSRFLILAGWFLAIILVCFGRLVISFWQSYLMKKYHYGANRVLVIGQNGLSEKIISRIKQSPDLGYFLVGNLAEPDLAKIKSEYKDHLDEVILTNTDWPKENVLELVNFCEENHLVFKFVPNLFQTLTTNTSVELMGDLPLVELKRTTLDGWGRIIKRLFDLVSALFGLIILSPLFLVLAVLIKSDSEGPVLVKLKRVSQNKEFQLYKFRSMVKNAEALKESLRQYNIRKDSPLFKMVDDPRITRLGRFLRKYRLDELAQLINVFKGEMGLVGPRPHQPDEIAQYQKHHKKVLAIKAGATGLAQVSGASDLPFEEEVRLDTFYIENWSFWLDLKIILKTIVVVFKRPSTY